MAEEDVEENDMGLKSAYMKLKAYLAQKGIGKYKLAQKVNSAITPMMKETDSSKCLEIQGHKMLLDEGDSLNLSVNGIYERLETGLVQKEVKQGDIIVDIGANIGYYTLMFAKLVGQSGRVYAFEPDPTNFEILKKNVELNGYENVVLVKKAVSDKNGTTKLYLSENKADHRIFFSNDESERKSIDIETVRLDDFFSQMGARRARISFIKMDIQGAELSALNGMKDLVSLNKPKIVTEFSPIQHKRFGYDYRHYLNLIYSLGYAIFEVNERNGTIKKTDSAALLKEYTPEKFNYTNLFCVPKSALKEVGA